MSAVGIEKSPSHFLRKLVQQNVALFTGSLKTNQEVSWNCQGSKLSKLHFLTWGRSEFLLFFLDWKHFWKQKIWTALRGGRNEADSAGTDTPTFQQAAANTPGEVFACCLSMKTKMILLWTLSRLEDPRPGGCKAATPDNLPHRKLLPWFRFQYSISGRYLLTGTT